mgnify:FL=1
MMTYRQLLNESREYLKNAGVADAEIDAWYLLSHVFGISRADFLLYGQDECPKDKVTVYKKLIEKRAARIPLQYITGVQEFMGLEFDVDENVLIPRQDTEILVEEVLKVCKGKSVLDLCTGSGCIILSLAKYGNLKMAVGSDISEKALQVARKNAKKLNLDVLFICSDLFEKIEGKYDIIVSNPPYIKSEDYISLMPEVRDHEPKLALEAGTDGLIFYRRIINDLPRFLNPGGFVFFEIGYDQGGAVEKLLSKAGFTDIKVKKDLSGLDRVVYAKTVSHTK